MPRTGPPPRILINGDKLFDAIQNRGLNYALVAQEVKCTAKWLGICVHDGLFTEVFLSAVVAAINRLNQGRPNNEQALIVGDFKTADSIPCNKTDPANRTDPPQVSFNLRPEGITTSSKFPSGACDEILTPLREADAGSEGNAADEQRGPEFAPGALEGEQIRPEPNATDAVYPIETHTSASLACITVPSTAGETRRALAYPIARNRFLTVASFLKTDDRQGRGLWCETAELQWPTSGSLASTKRQPARILWNGHDVGWDVAVLETAIPEPFSGTAATTWTSPQVGQDVTWFGLAEEHSAGRAGSIVTLRGTITASFAVAGLGIEISPENVALTEGLVMRGSPIFWDSQLLGVVLDCQGTMIYGHWLWQLASDRTFLHASGLSVEELKAERHKVAQEEVVSLLATQPVLAAGLFAWVQQRSGNHHTESTAVRLNTIAKVLLSKDMPTKLLLAGLHAVAEKLRGTLDREAAQAFLRIVRCLLPQQVEAHLPLQLHLDDGGVLSLNAWTETMAELALARLEGRSAHFVESDDSGNIPRGANALRRELWTPDLADETTIETRATAIVEHLYWKETVIHPKTGKAHPLVSQEGRAVTDSEEKSFILRQRMRILMQRGYAPYFTYRQTENRESNGVLEALAKAVKHVIPEFVVVRLSGKQSCYSQEFEQLNTLTELIDELLTGSLTMRKSTDAVPQTR